MAPRETVDVTGAFPPPEAAIGALCAMSADGGRVLRGGERQHVPAMGGKVLVNDAGRRQIKLFDSTLAAATTVMDSVSGTSRSYGRRPAPLIPYLGDSTLVPDYMSRTMTVLDSRGQVARSLALPTPSDLTGMCRRGGVSGF